MEQSEHWPEIFAKVDPSIVFHKGVSRVDSCPEYSEHIEVVTDYELTMIRKMTTKSFVEFRNDTDSSLNGLY